MNEKCEVDIVFTDKLHSDGISECYYFDLSDIEAFINIADSPHLDYYINSINAWLAQLGMANNKIDWWCFNASTRNPLASRLIYDLLAFHCCIEKIQKVPARERIFLINAPTVLKNAIYSYFGSQTQTGKATVYLSGLYVSFISILRLTWQLSKAWLTFIPISQKPVKKGAIGLFTFMDGGARTNGDPYFGMLDKMIAEIKPDKQVEHLALVYQPYRKRLADGEEYLRTNYSLLFSYLRSADYFKTWWKYVCMSFKVFKPDPANKSIPAEYLSILRHTLKSEISRGAAEHYLIYLAFRNLDREKCFDKIVYPFENKSVEKCLLTGLTEGQITTVGYQHSSITKRHYALQLMEGEFDSIPMPDKIITVGDITANWLRNRGNFPPDRVVTGFSLRQTFIDGKHAKARFTGAPNILFALSSSKYELYRTVLFMQDIKNQLPQWNLGIRCHPNFPLTTLDQKLQNWILEETSVFAGTTLASNLEWADILAYISSTVALESLLAKVPVIRLDLEALNSDPLLNPPALSWECSGIEGFISAVTEIQEMNTNEREKRVIAAKNYVHSYLKPYTENVVTEFIT